MNEDDFLTPPEIDDEIDLADLADEKRKRKIEDK
jgi:hypothetical protein